MPYSWSCRAILLQISSCSRLPVFSVRFCNSLLSLANIRLLKFFLYRCYFAIFLPIYQETMDFIENLKRVGVEAGMDVYLSYIHTCMHAYIEFCPNRSNACVYSQWCRGSVSVVGFMPLHSKLAQPPGACTRLLLGSWGCLSWACDVCLWNRFADMFLRPPWAHHPGKKWFCRTLLKRRDTMRVRLNRSWAGRPL